MIIRLALFFCTLLIFVSFTEAQSRCPDKVRSAVWRTLDGDILSGNWDCKKVLEIKRIKRSAPQLYVVRGYGLPFCGATGNCSTWVVEVSGKKARIVLDAGSVIEPFDIATGGKYPILSFRGRMGGGEFYRGTYVFTAGRYSLKDCLNEYSGVSPTKLKITLADRKYCGTAA
jgi:hypothetical protein